MPDVRISELPAAATPGDADLAPLVQSSGTTLETRRATVSQLRTAVLADRGAHVRDYGAVGDGVANDAPAIQAAINDLKGKGGGTLSFGPRVYRIASPVSVNGATIRFQGAGFTEGFGPGQGTWLRIDGTGFTPFSFSGDVARGSAVRDIGVTQVHGAAQDASWAPTNYDFVFRVEDCFGGVDFDNLFLANVNRGIYARNSGRLDIRRLRGQVFTTGVEIDQCYDIPRIHSVHLWPFWSGNNNVVRWQQANGDAMVFRRCDGVFIDQAFALGYRSMFRFSGSAAGNTTKFYIGQAYTDFTQYGVVIEADGTDGQIANFTHQGEIFNAGGAPLAGGVGLLVNASNTRVQAGNLRIDAVEDSAIRLYGANNRLDIFSLRCVRYNYRNNGSPAIFLGDSGGATPNAVYLGSPPLLEAGNGGPLVNTDTNGGLSAGGPAGRGARPGVTVGAPDTGLFQPFGGALSASAGGTEILRATASAIQLGAPPGGHALEVATPIGGANRLAVFGGGSGSAVSVQAQGADANIDLWVTAKGGGLLRTVAPAAGDTSSAVATTAWVRAQGYINGFGGAGAPTVTSVAGRTGDVTLTTTDIGGFATAAAAAAPVASVAGRTGAVTLTTTDIGGFAAAAAAAAPVASVAGRTGAVTLSTADIGGFATAAAAAAPVASVAGRTGAVTLTTTDIGGFATAAAAAAPVASVAGRTGAVTLTTADIGGFATAAAAASPVQSVAGRTGAITLTTVDVAGVAPLASPAFTGAPTAPTPALADNSTAIATTAWVRSQGYGAGSASLPAPVVQSQKWLSPPFTNIVGLAIPANTLLLSPLPIQEAMTLDRLGLRISTAATGNCKLGAYRWDAAGSQFTLVAGSETGVGSTAVAGMLVLTPGTAIALTQPTLLWIASTFDGTPTVMTWNAGTANGGGMQPFIGQDESGGLPSTNLLAATAGFARLARTTALTWSSGAVTLPATIAATDLTRSAASPGSPVCVARRL